MFSVLKKFLSLDSPYEKRRSERVHTSARYGGMGERELQLRMEMILEESIADPNRSVFDSAKALTVFGLIDQERFLQAIQRLDNSNRELAYQFCLHGIKALRSLPEENWETWLTAIEQRLRKDGRVAAVVFMKNIEQYIQKISLPPHAVCLEDISPILERLLTAFSGRHLAIEKAQEIYTDTKTIYLPENCSQFNSREENFALYKVQAVYQWAQCNFGTWDVYSSHGLNEHDRSDTATKIFQVLENIRLDACIERELPGIDRLLVRFGKQVDCLPANSRWQTIAAQLSQPDASAKDSLRIMNTLLDSTIPETPFYQGVLKPLAVGETIAARVETNKAMLKKELGDYMKSLKSSDSSQEEPKKWSLSMTHPSAAHYEFELRYDDTPVEITPEMQELLETTMQDLGEIPPEYLQTEQDEPKKDIDTSVTEQATATALLPEWDYSINNYRQNWCQVFLALSDEGEPDFVKKTLVKHQYIVKRLKNTFEALREGDIRVDRQPEGDEIDIDAAIQTIIDIQSGSDAKQNIYLRNRKEHRDIAVMFMVDTSGSTAGWVNQLEKEALVLLCEALEKLGDRYAIYGFSTQTRKQCNLTRIKSFNETYNSHIGRKIAGMKPTGYTRIGAAIRFLSRELTKVSAKTRILITLSDGKPDDKDGYGGAYGIEDTRRALLETSFMGIHPYCITIDTNAKDYLSYMYSRANFSIINTVEKLPFKVSDIYRRITT